MQLIHMFILSCKTGFFTGLSEHFCGGLYWEEGRETDTLEVFKTKVMTAERE